jgi:hypothetical protein
LVSLETTLNEIMGLAESNMDMEYEAYNGSMVRTVRQLFHVDMVEKLTFPGTAKYKIEKMKEFAVNLREAKQELLKDHEGQILFDGGGGAADGSHGGATESVGDSSEEDDEDYHSDGPEIGGSSQSTSESDEEHRQEPGGDA